MIRRFFVWTLVLVLLLPAAADARRKKRKKRPPQPEPPHYELDLRLIPEGHRLGGRGVLRLPPEKTPRREIVLILSELADGLSVEIDAPAIAAGPPAEIRDELLLGARPGWGTRRWTIVPAAPIPAGEPVVLHFVYALGEPDYHTAAVMHLSPEIAFASGINTAWYPQVEEPLPNREDRRPHGRRAIGELRFAVSDDRPLVAIGKRLRGDEPGDHRFEISTPAYFSFAAASYLRRPGAIEGYLLREREHDAEHFERIARIRSLLADAFGPLPYRGLKIVETPDDVSEAAGFVGATVDGLLFVNSRFFEPPNTAFLGHEIGHLWWGNLIRPAENRGAWMLSEALAQYSSLLAVEAIEGEEKAEAYRRNGYPGYLPEQSGAGYLRLLARGDSAPLVALDGPYARIIADSKGFMVWDLLARTIGVKRFHQALRRLIEERAPGRVTWGDLQEFLKGEDSSAESFLRQWTETDARPQWDLEWFWDSDGDGGVVRAVITQDEPFFDAAVELEAHGGSETQNQEARDGDRRALRRVMIRGARTEIGWPLAFEPRRIELDPFARVPWAIRDPSSSKR